MVDYTKISEMGAASTATGAELVEVVQSGTNKKMTVDQINAPVKAYADSLVVGLLDDRGNYDASSNLFPATGGSGPSGAIKKGDVWLISVAGTLGGKEVDIGDSVRALVDTPAQTAANWAIMLGTGETFVSFDKIQSSTTAQKKRARENIGVDVTTVATIADLPAASDYSGVTLSCTQSRCNFISNGSTWIQSSIGVFDWADKPSSPIYGLKVSIGNIASCPPVVVWDGEHWIPENFVLAKNIFAYAFRDNSYVSSGDGFSVITSGAGAVVGLPTIGEPTGAVWPGYVQVSTGNTSTGRVGIGQGIAAAATLSQLYDVAQGDLETTHSISLAALSTGTERYSIGAGWRDSSALANIVNGAYFEYSDNVNGGKFLCRTIAGGVASTPVDSGITVAINTAYKLTVKLSTTAARFYINGALVATITTNLPSGSAQRTASMCMLEKSAGSTSASALFDYHEFMQFLINPRT